MWVKSCWSGGRGGGRWGVACCLNSLWELCHVQGMCVCVWVYERGWGRWWGLHGNLVAPARRRRHLWLKRGAVKRHVTSPDASFPVDVVQLESAQEGKLIPGHAPCKPPSIHTYCPGQSPCTTTDNLQHWNCSGQVMGAEDMPKNKEMNNSFQARVWKLQKNNSNFSLQMYSEI